MEPILNAKGLTKRYGKVTALNDCDFELYPGEILAVIGDNGAGKSSLIKAISGAVTPDEGEILLDGKPIAFKSPMEARAAGIRAKVTSLPVKHLSRAVVSYRREGVIKIVADADSDRLLGIHMVAPNAGDVIGEAVVAIRFGLRAQELVSTLHPYLTWGEGLKLAAQTFTKDVAKLSCCA